MPMYFMLSGLVANPSNTELKDTFFKRFKRLLLPVILFLILFTPIYLFSLYRGNTTITWRSIVSGYFYINGQIGYNDPLWFFICLFQIYLVYDIFQIYRCAKRNQVILAVLVFIIGFVLFHFRINYLGIGQLAIGLGFFTIGQYLKDYKNILITNRLLLVLSFVVWFIFGNILNGKCSMYGLGLDNYWYFIISGLTGAIVFFNVAKLFENIHFINQYSQWTLFIVASHYIFVTAFNALASYIGFKYTLIFDYTSLAYVLCMLLFYKPLCKFIDKHYPILNGKLK